MITQDCMADLDIDKILHWEKKKEGSISTLYSVFGTQISFYF